MSSVRTFCCYPVAGWHGRSLMAWIKIVVSVIFLWVVSLCKILYASFSPSKAEFLHDEDFRIRNVLLVTAHPDDESMFFTPTINYLTSRGHYVHILCMSTGDAGGLGYVRKNELFLASAALKILPLHVKIIDHPSLKDGFGNAWNHDLVESFLEQEICANAIDVIITFDNYGVSGHCNHHDVHQGVRNLVNRSRSSVEAWELVSNNIFRKYSGPVDIWMSIFSPMLYPNGQMICLLNPDPYKSYSAMRQHMSQWVWFRKLFVSFSSYTYVNTLRKIVK